MTELAKKFLLSEQMAEKTFLLQRMSRRGKSFSMDRETSEKNLKTERSANSRVATFPRDFATTAHFTRCPFADLMNDHSKAPQKVEKS